MALNKTPKAKYVFEMNPAVEVNPFQNIRGTKDGVEVTLPVQVHAVDGAGKVSEPKPPTSDDADSFKASIAVDKEYTIDGETYKVTKVTKKGVKLESAEHELTLTPDELYNQAE